MADTAFCYHCRQHHPKSEMRQIETKAGKRWRATIYAQDEASSVVWGMPRSVAEAGLADSVLNLKDMAAAIATRIRGSQGALVNA